MSSRVFAPRSNIQRIRGPADRISALSSTPPRIVRSPSPAVIRPPSQSQKQGPTPCKNCGGTETVEADGNIVCEACGLVLSNTPNYTSDIAFEEGANGRIQQQGQRVVDGQTHQKAFAPRGIGGGPGHEVTPAGDRAKAEATGVMRRFAMLLRIDEREINMGRRIFDMAYNRGFVRGRTIDSVAIVSLYIATRRAKDRKPIYDIMLIDLAEQANINVFDLGKMMQDQVKCLYLNPDGTMSKDDHFYLQAHGAEVLIDKFVNHLDFGPDTQKIKNDAGRILQRMKRDWLHHGRRPSGVCGAAVILAARMNNYRRTLREVVLVAKVTELTVKQRLGEFKDTESSDLSVEDFRDDEILSSLREKDPPAYSRALLPPKKKGRKARKNLSAKGKAPITAIEIEDSDQASEVDSVVGDDAIEQPPAKRRRLDADGFAIPDLPTRVSQASQTSMENIDPALQQATPESTPVTRSVGRPKGSKAWRAPPPTEEELAYEAELTESMQQALDSNQDIDPNRPFPTPPATQNTDEQSQSTSPSSAPSPPRDETNDTSEEPEESSPLPLRVNPADCDPRKGPPGPAVNTDIGNTSTISLDPIISESEFDDDIEVSTCLLSESERVLKEKIWVTENADWLRQDHAKKIRKELKDRHLREMGINPDEVQGAKKGEIRKRKDGARRSGRIGDVEYLKDDFHKNHAEDEGEEANDDGGRRPSSASMAVKAMLRQRGPFSRRINYDNLIKVYELPSGSSASLSRSISRSPSQGSDLVSREGSVISVSTAGGSNTRATSSIGPIFKDVRRSVSRRKSTRTRTPAATRRKTANSASPEFADEPGRQRSGSALSPEPVSARSHDGGSSEQVPDQDEVEVVGEVVSSSGSPLLSIRGPPPQSSSVTRRGANAASSTESSGAHAPGPVDDAGENDGNDKDKDNEEEEVEVDVEDDADEEDQDENDDDEDDEEDDDDDNDPDEDLENAFNGTFSGGEMVWEGEEEIVED